MKTILVTGGPGFIGSNLCDKLLNEGYKVICLDNLITGSRDNIEPFISNPNFTFINGDICNYKDCEIAVRDADCILHQAALGSVPRSIQKPILTTNINVLGFVNILFAAKEAKIKRFIYAASSSTYGDHPDLPKVEDKIGNPLSPYAITKYTNELYAENFSKIYDMELIGLRYFNVFGKNQSPNGAYAAVIPKFIIRLINHESPTINGDGSFSRDFTYIDNVVQANLLAIEVDSKKIFNRDKYLSHEIFNIAFGESTTLNELVIMLKNNLANFDENILKIKSIYGPEKKGDVPHSLASIDKAKNILGYNPKFSVKEGLGIACKWYYDNYNNNNAFI